MSINFDPGNRNLPNWMQEMLDRPDRTIYIGPDGLVNTTPRGAAMSNACWEESYGRPACNRMLDNDPDWGNAPGYGGDYGW